MFLDAHSHILPNQDDGSRSIAETVELARIASAEGIDTILCTPHLYYENKTAPERRDVALAQSQVALLDSGIAITLIPGFEVLVGEWLLECDYLRSLSLGRSRHLLVEFPFDCFPLFWDILYKKIEDEGLIAILAHPERYPYLQENYSRLQTLHNSGLLFQMNLASITGQLGAGSRKTAIKLLKDNLVDFLGTDTHQVSWREPRVIKELQMVRKIMGSDSLDALLENQRKTFAGVLQ